MIKSLRRPAFPLTVTAAVLFAFALCSRAAAPAPRAYVNDEAGVMDARTAGELNGVLSELDARAKAQVAVLVVNTLGGADIETYAAAIYKKWGVGDLRTNRGVLLLVAVQDHKARIEVGYGLEGILPDGLTGGIQDKYMVPYFRKGDYSGGVSQGALAIASVIAQDSGAELSAGPAQGRTDPLPPLTPGQKLLSLLLIGFVVILFIRHPFLMFFLLNTMNSRGGGGFGRGGFGGFGGGMSGGGGSSRSW